MSITALKKLIGSSKATVLVAVIILVGVLVYTGKMTSEQFEAILKWLVPTWMLAHAGEQGAKAIANGKAKPAEQSVSIAPVTIDTRDYPKVANAIAERVVKAVRGEI